MPLARLTIKAAVRGARTRVARISRDGTSWMVCTRYPNGQVDRRGPYSRASAKAVQREQRIFVALLLLGVESNDALQAALVAATDARNWRLVVASAKRLYTSKSYERTFSLASAAPMGHKYLARESFNRTENGKCKIADRTT